MWKSITSLFLARETNVDKIYPLLIPGGYAAIAIPRIKEEFSGKVPEIMTEWVGEEAKFFHSME